ncbi:MAG: ribosome maturation factor RimP [Pseudohongiellaceae bacterium]|nr:ribosome maturation factor RimP [Pseudohongiellaceae bacterium]
MSASDIAQMIEPTVEALGVELWGIELIAQGRHSILRVYIENHEDGISIEDCEKVSRQISGIFDVEDPISGEYTLEVSSPGMDRPLFNEGQYALYIDELVNVRLRSPINGRRKFKGLIKKVEDGQLHLVVDNEAVDFPIAVIDKANLVY